MEAKRCPTCEKTKSVDQFNFKNKKTGSRCHQCKICWNAANKLRYQKNKKYYIEKANRAKKQSLKLLREKIIDYLQEHPCVDCGETDLMVLQFDHVRGTKKREVSSLVHRCFAWETVQEEIAKCDVRCANCHLRRTAKSRGFWSTKL